MEELPELVGEVMVRYVLIVVEIAIAAFLGLLAFAWIAPLVPVGRP